MIEVPTTLKSGAKSVGALILLSAVAAAVVSLGAMALDMAVPSLGIGAKIKQYIPLKWA